MCGWLKDVEFLGHLAGQLEQPANFAKRQDRQQHACKEQYHHLHEVGPGRGLHAAVDRISARSNEEEDVPPCNMLCEPRVLGRREFARLMRTGAILLRLRNGLTGIDWALGLKYLFENQSTRVQRAAQQRENVSDYQ